MKTILSFLVLLASVAFAQELLNITIKVELKGKPGTVSIAGNQEVFGLWQADKVFLDTDDSVNYYKTFSIPKNTLLEFKFTRGAWQFEAANSDGSIPGNYTFCALNDTTVEYLITNWRDEFESQRIVTGQITGKVAYYDNMSYPGILDRNVVVWTPPGYETGDESYPVLYMHDGQNIFDPATSYFGIDWQVDEAADSLIRQGKIEPMIIVGIYNTIHRRPEYSYTDTGYVYMKFLVEKLKPFIDKKYRTKPDRENTSVGGSSMGGLISFMLLWEYNNVFSKAICMSPAFKVRQLDYVKRISDYSGKRKEFFAYIDIGGVGLEVSLQPGIDDMINFLKQKGYTEGTDFEYIIEQNAEHNEPAWARRIPHAMITLYGKK